MSDELQPDAMNAIESAWRSLTPASSGLSRDQVLFAAGRASAAPRRVLWPATAVLGWGLAIGMSGLRWSQNTQLAQHTASPPTPAPAVTLTQVAPPAAHPLDTAARDSYGRVRAAFIGGNWELPKLPYGPADAEQEPAKPLRLRDLL